MVTKTECTVLFADITGSTGLYGRYGDEQARKVLSQCIALMCDICRQHGGAIVKTIGDEVMCRFDRPDEAVGAACGIHRSLEGGVGFGGIRLTAHIGLHYGSAFIVGGDVHGDAPNLAARMTSIAKSGQIITTQGTVECLSPAVAASARWYDKITLKGGTHATSIYEVLWEQENATRLVRLTDLTDTRESVCLKLSYQSHEVTATPETPVVLLGRRGECTLVVEAELVSRVHARIEYRRENFVLIDQSANGTFIKPDDARVVYLRREEMPLSGRGYISLGRTWRPDDVNLVHYSEQLSATSAP